MAFAKIEFKPHTRQVQRSVTVQETVEKPQSVTLTLTKKEARVLATILRFVGGSPEASFRKQSDAIEGALKAAGVGYFAGKGSWGSTGLVEPRSGIVFRDEAEVPSELIQDSLKERPIWDEVVPTAPSVPEEAPKVPFEFRPGDKVRVVRKVAKEAGWSNVWSSLGMDCYVNGGITYTISECGGSGYRFEEDGDFGWPSGALELIERFPEVGDKVILKNSGGYGCCHAGMTGVVHRVHLKGEILAVDLGQVHPNPLNFYYPEEVGVVID